MSENFLFIYLFYVYSANGRKKIEDLSKSKATTEESVHPLIAKELRRLREGQDALERKLKKEKKMIRPKKTDPSSIRTKLERGLSLPDIPGLNDLIPKYPPPAERKLSEPQLPTELEFKEFETSSSEDLPNTRPPLQPDVQYPKGGASWASATSIPWQNGNRYKRWGPIKQQPEQLSSDAFVVASEGQQWSSIPVGNKIKHYLEELLGRYRESEESDVGYEKSSKLKKSKKLIGTRKKEKAKKKKEEKSKKKKPSRLKHKDSPLSSNLSDRPEGVKKNPTIYATGGMRLENDEASIGSGFGTGVQPKMTGEVGIGGGYPYGSIGFLPQGVSPGTVPLKPTLEHHLSPAAMTPFATFKYPEPPKEPKPIVVHLHHHAKEEQKSIPGIEEAENVGIATAATLRNLIDKEEAEKPPPPPPFAPAPLGALPWGGGPPLGYVPMGQVHSPSNFKLGFEGSVNVDPAFLQHRRRRRDISSSSESSSSKSSSESSSESSSSDESSLDERKRKDLKRTEDKNKKGRRKKYEESSSKEEIPKKKTLSQRLKTDRQTLVKKLIQQLYYFPDASGAVVERTLQDVLPLLQPFERSQLISTIQEYRKAIGASSFNVPKKSLPASAVRGRYEVPLSHMSEESTTSLSELDTEELIGRIREVERVERKHQRATLRGETGGYRARTKALVATELKKGLRRLKTSELLKQLQNRETRFDRDVFHERGVSNGQYRSEEDRSSKTMSGKFLVFVVKIVHLIHSIRCTRTAGDVLWIGLTGG